MKKEFVFRLVLALGIFFLVYQFALKPMLDNKSVDDKSEDMLFKSASTGDEYDVVILAKNLTV